MTDQVREVTVVFPNPNLEIRGTTRLGAVRRAGGSARQSSSPERVDADHHD
jgi:hypothetical protein